MRRPGRDRRHEDRENDLGHVRSVSVTTPPFSRRWGERLVDREPPQRGKGARTACMSNVFVGWINGWLGDRRSLSQKGISSEDGRSVHAT